MAEIPSGGIYWQIGGVPGSGSGRGSSLGAQEAHARLHDAAQDERHSEGDMSVLPPHLWRQPQLRGRQESHGIPCRGT